MGFLFTPKNFIKTSGKIFRKNYSVYMRRGLYRTVSVDFNSWGFTFLYPSPLHRFGNMIAFSLSESYS